MAETETRQIVMMQTWLCQWYQDCRQAVPVP